MKHGLTDGAVREGGRGAFPLTHVPAVPCLRSRAPAPRRQEEPICCWEYSVAVNGMVMGFGYPEGRAEVKVFTGFQIKPSIKGLKAISLLQ